LAQMADLQRTLDKIEYKQGYYRQAVADGTEKYVKAGIRHSQVVATDR
ncbi:MerR family transcriptional regulator, partial [Lacticaseibacillus paracasei]